MAKRDGKRAATKKSIKILSLLLLAVAFVITCLSVIAAAIPEYYNVNIGEASPYTIYAPQDVVDRSLF